MSNHYFTKSARNGGIRFHDWDMRGSDENRAKIEVKESSRRP